jgi:hypothetical protein
VVTKARENILAYTLARIGPEVVPDLLTRISQMGWLFRHGVCAISLENPAFFTLPAETTEEPNG